MPITKQAIKRVKQDAVRQARNRHYASRMKSMVKLLLSYVKEGKKEMAEKILSDVIKSIDTAAKKNLIPKNNAAHKKSRVQKALNGLSGEKKKEEKGGEKTDEKMEKEEGNS
ncbi:30S ribosomal protein S20 [Candidatus Peregrinibacteria bacterium CG_4_10_14_0_2_um_filter_43_11]|nr:MAG: 30S ribosomal protein S20 [Candidatus Peregrinibacteria bacterium CG_4_10_14_0_2_um_filter_43_11]